MASKQTSQNFKFQYYIDMAKQKKIHWNVFVNLMEDLSYSNIDRLKYLNASVVKSTLLERNSKNSIISLLI